MIGGQALIEGIMMRGPDKDAVVVRGKEGLTVEVTPRKLAPEKSPLRWPLIRGVYNFFGSNIVGVKALMRSADLSPEEGEVENPSKFDQWLEKSWATRASRRRWWALPLCWGWECRWDCSSFSPW